MAAMMDYYDPDEIRRRQMMAPMAGDPTPAGGLPGVDNIMAPESGEEEEGSGSASPDHPMNRAGMAESPAMQAYRKALGSQPQAQDYKPSKLRRFGAALAGFGAGMRDPAKGVEVAHNLIYQPFEDATARWKSQMEQAGTGLALDEKSQAQDIARQRATAYGVSADARMKAANATEEYRKFQESHQPWHPMTKEDTIEVERAKQRPTGWQPQTMDEYTKVHPVRDFKSEEEMRAKQAKDLENLRAQHEMEREKVRQAGATSRAANRQGTPASPKNTEEAEQIALNELLRTRPEFKSFVKGGDVIKGKPSPRQVITADELPKSGGGFLGMGGVSEAQASLAREQYRQFLSELDKHKKRVLGRQAGPTWDIQPDEEEE